MELHKAPAAYLILLESSRYYTGATRDMKERWAAHKRGEACRTTQVDPPVELAYVEDFNSFPEAAARERQIKPWSRAKKEALAAGDLQGLKRFSKRRVR